ncbi:MAG: hypothetical protein ABF617_05920 [Gluconobacter japonicus]|uniref:phage fiber-tail adaptor protein n=1 Tax=Gluconobacter japonicus TaxID=376620 RepID=UPI0039EC2CFC
MMCRERCVSLQPLSSFRVRGLYSPINLQWPDAHLNSSADYSVDFSSQLCCDETLSNAAFALSGATLGWSGKPTFSGGVASAWINWTATGQQAIQVTVLTTGGRSLSANVTINVLPEVALLPPASPAVAPNILTLPDGTPLTTDTGSDLLSQ